MGLTLIGPVRGHFAWQGFTEALEVHCCLGHGDGCGADKSFIRQGRRGESGIQASHIPSEAPITLRGVDNALEAAA